MTLSCLVDYMLFEVDDVLSIVSEMYRYKIIFHAIFHIGAAALAI